MKAATESRKRTKRQIEASAKPSNTPRTDEQRVATALFAMRNDSGDAIKSAAKLAKCKVRTARAVYKQMETEGIWKCAAHGLLSVSQVATVLGVSDRRVRAIATAAIEHGHLDEYIVRNLGGIPVAEVDHWAGLRVERFAK